MLKNGLWFLRNNPLILKKWLPDVNLLKEDVGIVPVWVKLHGVPVMTFSEDELSVIATKLSNGETKNLKKPSQTPKGILVGQKMGFKPTKQQVYQPVSKKPTTNTSRNKKKNVKPTKEVSKSNSFDVLTSIENDVKLGKPLKKVDDDSDDEAGSVDNEMASFLAKKDGYGTQSLLEQWKDSYEDDDYEYDPYDDDMYEGQEIPEKLQAFCDNLDIKVRVVSVPPIVVTPTVEMTNDGFQTVGKKKNKGKTKSTNGGQFGGYSVKQTVRYEPKATTSVIVASNKEGNITMSNSYAALDYERIREC
ncbi:zinc knuckle CX2CX4HX4C containing protein [Tanacetum coccineum]